MTATEVTVDVNVYGALAFSGGGTNRIIHLGDIGPGVVSTHTFTATVNAADGIYAEMDASIADGTHGVYDWYWIHHEVDTQPPYVEITYPLEYVRPYTQTVYGVSMDPSGVPSITLSWRPIPGGVEKLTSCTDPTPLDGLWTCAWNAGNLFNFTHVLLRAKAADGFGNESGWTDWITLSVDTNPPTVTLDASFEAAIADGFMTANESMISGQVVDDQRAHQLETCSPNNSGMQCNSRGVTPGTTPVGTWSLLLDTDDLDGVWRTLAFTGVDWVGNRSEPVTRTFRIDTVPPVVTVTQVISQVLFSDYMTGSVTGGPVLGGTVTDGSGVKALYIRLETPSGKIVWQAANLTGDTWEFIPQLEEAGHHILYIEAYDLAGNASGYGPFDLYVQPLSQYFLPMILKNYTGQWVVYRNDFEIGAGDEWTISTTNRTPTGRGFLGEFGNTPTCLNLQNLPSHSRATVVFDLYIIRSWDGNQITRLASWLPSLQAPSHLIGPDEWWIKVDGLTLLNTSFTNWDALGFHQAYPDAYPGGDHPARTEAVENNTLGYYYGTFKMDSVYRLDFSTLAIRVARCKYASQV